MPLFRAISAYLRCSFPLNIRMLMSSYGKFLVRYNCLNEWTCCWTRHGARYAVAYLQFKRVDKSYATGLCASVAFVLYTMIVESLDKVARMKHLRVVFWFNTDVMPRRSSRFPLYILRSRWTSASLNPVMLQTKPSRDVSTSLSLWFVTDEQTLGPLIEFKSNMYNF